MPVSVEEIAGRLPPVSHLHSSFYIAHIEYLCFAKPQAHNLDTSMLSHQSKLWCQ